MLLLERDFKIDPVSGNVVQYFSCPGTLEEKCGPPYYAYPCGLAWDGAYLWHVDPEMEKIYKIDPSTGVAVGSFNTPSGTYPTGLAWDGAYLWASDPLKEKIYKIDVTQLV